MDEVIAATAYLDLFLRTIYEPALLKVFIKFILCAKIDEISLLDTLINRINFTTKVKTKKRFEIFKFCSDVLLETFFFFFQRIF